MEKVFVAITAATLAVFLVACGMGLDPAKTDTTTVSLSFAVASPGVSTGATDASRAIIPDGGYLYIRMIGGPTAETSDYLGPYQITAESPSVSITEIPAGQYDGMFLLYAARPVHDDPIEIEGFSTTLGDILSLPDDAFVAFIDDEEEEGETSGNEETEENHPVDVLLEGLASIGFIEDPRINEGVANTFLVTMLPVTPYWIEFDPTMMNSPLELEELLVSLFENETEYDSFKGFIEISGIDSIFTYSPSFSGSLQLTFANASSTESMTLNSLSVYNGDGTLAATPSGTFPKSLTAGVPYSVTIETLYDEIFFYLDVEGGSPTLTITLGEEVGEVEVPEMVSVSGSLDLSAYVDNFETVDAVYFSTTPPVSSDEVLSLEPESETLPEEVVGVGTLEESQPETGIYTIDGLIFSENAETPVYLIIVGTNLAYPVVYTSTSSYTISGMELLAPEMTPLFQYLMISSTAWFQEVGGSVTITIRDSSEEKIVDSHTQEIIELPSEEILPAPNFGAILLLDSSIFIDGEDYALEVESAGDTFEDSFTSPEELFTLIMLALS